MKGAGVKRAVKSAGVKRGGAGGNRGVNCAGVNRAVHGAGVKRGSQSHSRISSLFVCARVPFVYEPSVNVAGVNGLLGLELPHARLERCNARGGGGGGSLVGCTLVRPL